MAERFLALLFDRPLAPRQNPGIHFSERLSGTQGHSAAARIRSIEKSGDLIGN
jgi:hypothetical protein